MADFLCLMRGGDARFANMNEAETQAHMAKWNVYMGKLGAAGNLKGGAPLNRDGAIVSGVNAEAAAGPHTDGGQVGGYLLLSAENLDAAVKLTHGCPLLEVGGAIEVREIAPM